jgi:phage terminase large subunit
LPKKGKASQFSDAELLRQLAKREIDQETLETEEAKPRTIKSLPFLKGLFQQQSDFIVDPAKRKIAFCSRQAGKSYICCAYLALTALSTYKSSSLYVAVSREKIKELVWYDLKDFDERWSLGFEFNNVDMSVFHPVTKSRIYFRGCETPKEQEKVLGGRYNLILVDEAQSLSNLDDFVNRILTPAIGAKDGTLCLMGTPAPRAFGLFYDLTAGSGRGWSVHRWTLRENPHFLNVEEFLAGVLRDNAWTEDNPHFQREYLGKWVISHDRLVYKYDPKKNALDKIPEGLNVTLGIDFGFNDPTALVVCGTRADDPNFYVIGAWQKAELTTSDVAAILEDFRLRHGARSIIADTGGLGKGYVEEYRKRYGQPVIAAKKDREFSIDALRDELITGRVKILNDPSNPYLQALIEELCSIQWRDNSKYEFDRKFPDHLTDALRYCHANSYHYRQGKKAIAGSSASNPDAYVDQLVKRLEQGKEMSWQKKSVFALRKH